MLPGAGSSGIGGRSRHGDRATTDAIVHDRVKRLGRRCDAAFWTGTRGGMGPGLVTAFHSSWTGRAARGRRFTTTSGDGRDRLWLLTTYNLRNGMVEYVVITPAFTAAEIKIRVLSNGERHSRATITYRRFALAPGGNTEVAKLDAHWAQQQPSRGETAMNGALTKGGIQWPMGN